MTTRLQQETSPRSFTSLGRDSPMAILFRHKHNLFLCGAKGGCARRDTRTSRRIFMSPGPIWLGVLAAPRAQPCSRSPFPFLASILRSSLARRSVAAEIQLASAASCMSFIGARPWASIFSKNAFAASRAPAFGDVAEASASMAQPRAARRRQLLACLASRSRPIGVGTPRRITACSLRCRPS